MKFHAYLEEDGKPRRFWDGVRGWVAARPERPMARDVAEGAARRGLVLGRAGVIAVVDAASLRSMTLRSRISTPEADAIVQMLKLG